MRLKKLLLWDFYFQLKYKVIFVALFLMLVYLSIVYFIPKQSASFFLPLAFLTDFGVTSFLFVCAMVYFERGQGTLSALVVSPVKISEYILSKVITISTTISSIGIVLIVGSSIFKDINVNYFFGVLSSVLTCTFFAFLGILFSTYFKNFTDVLLPMGAIFTFLFTPFLSFFNINSLNFLNNLYFLFPTNSMLKVMEQIFKTNLNIFLILHIAYILLFNFILYKLCILKLNQNIINRSDDIDK